jgi:HAMP domain-containing protein
MLRRKLLIRLGVLVGVLVIAAVGAIWLLQGVLKDLDHVNEDAAALVDGTQELSTALTSVEGELYEPLRGARSLDAPHLKAEIARARTAYSALGLHEMTRPPLPGATPYAHMGDLLDSFLSAAGRAAEGGSVEDARRAMGESVDLRKDLLALVEGARLHVTNERSAVVSRLRFMVLGMSIAALVVVTTAVLLLLWTAEMILRPVDALVEASRELGQEHFDYDVQLDREDEFGELARAYNSLAAQLAANEQRKMETLQQTSLMLSHEVNNVLGIIAMQLALADRQAAGNTLLKQHLNQINASLTRMAETVAALGRVRRIVLKDYLPGQKMLDLPRSVAEKETETQA